MANKTEVSWLVTGLTFIALFAFILATAAPLAAFVFQSAWTWFAVPLGAPPIGFWHAMGIDLTVTFVASSGPPMDPKDADANEKLKHWAHKMYVRPLVTFALAWAVHQLMAGAP